MKFQIDAISILIIFLLLSSCTRNKINIESCSIKHPYKFSEEIVAEMERDTTIWKYEPAASTFSRIGEHKQSLVNWEKGRDALRKSYGFKDFDNISTDSVIQNYEQTNAIEYILSQANDFEVIMINEAHHNPRHRAFTAKLLPRLREQGFTKIGFEAVMDAVSDVKDYPSFGLGFYTAEPQFGELLRTAMQLDFDLFGYDDNGEREGADREKYQAKRIFEQIKDNGKDKIVIHCGFGHLWEDANNKSMGYFLKETYGIDPLTISQTRYIEQYTDRYEQPLYKALDIKESTVLIDKKGTIFNKGNDNNPEVDIHVFHPRTKYINGKPNWLEYKGKKITEIAIPEMDINCPCLVLAYPMEETITRSIPIDVSEINTISSPVFLSLNEDKPHKIVVQNKEGKGKCFDYNKE